MLTTSNLHASSALSGGRMMTALWTHAVEMGRCAGFNMAGKPRKPYPGTFGILNATQVADEPFVSMGLVHTQGVDCEVHCRSTATTYRKVVFDASGERLLGALFVGDISGAGLYRAIIRDRRPVAKIKGELIEGTVHPGHLMSL